MIEFPNSLEENKQLEEIIEDRISLLRALANFHVEKERYPDLDTLLNQRRQLLKSLKDLSRDFAKFVDASKDALSELKPKIASLPERENHSDVISKFISIVVPEEQQAAWQPDKFTGSLLVFFENGKIDSSSLIEKKMSMQDEQDLNEFDLADDFEVERPVKVVDEADESFTILKSPKDSNVNFYFTLGKEARVSLKIRNPLDVLVREIEIEYDRPGEYTIIWDRLDNEGNEVPKDRYFCQLQIADVQSQAKTIDL